MCGQVLWSSDSAHAADAAGWGLPAPLLGVGPGITSSFLGWERWIVSAWYHRLPCQNQAERTREMLGQSFPHLAVPYVDCPVFDLAELVVDVCTSYCLQMELGTHSLRGPTLVRVLAAVRRSYKHPSEQGIFSVWVTTDDAI